MLFSVPAVRAPALQNVPYNMRRPRRDSHHTGVIMKNLYGQFHYISRKMKFAFVIYYYKKNINNKYE